MRDNTKSTYLNLNASIDKINGWITAMQKYKSGIYVDASNTIPT